MSGFLGSVMQRVLTPGEKALSCPTQELDKGKVGRSKVFPLVPVVGAGDRRKV